MPHPVLGQPNSKWRASDMRGHKSAASSTSTAGGNGVPSGAAKTFIGALGADECAIIHKVWMSCIHDAAATQNTLTWNLNGGTMQFTSRGSATAPITNRYDLTPKGTMVVMPHATPGTAALTMQSSADAGWQVRVRYQRMRVLDAVTAGYLPGTPFIATAGSAGSGAPIDLITSATVTAARGLDVRGVVISGTQSNAASGAIKEIMVGFWDGATERKLVKNCYATANILASPQLVISNGLFRGPKGFGLRATFGENGTNARVSVWGYFYTDAQRTWPGTGVPPASATGAFDAGDYFWIYSENVAGLSVANWFPTTTVANLKNTYVIDGVVCTIGGSTGDAAMFNVGFTDNVKSFVDGFPLNAATAAGAVAYVREDMHMRLSVADPVAFGIATLAADVDKACMLAWGRFGGEQLVPGANTSYRAEELFEVS